MTTHTYPLARRPRRRTRMATFAASFAILAGGTGCDRPGDKPAEATTKPTETEDKHTGKAKLTAAAVKENGIKVEKASRRPLVPTATVPARLSYDLERMAHVGVPVGGRVAEVNVRLGDTVAKGDLVAVLDSPDLGEAQSEYLQRRAAVAVARPAVEFARGSAERAEQLKQSQGISITEVQRRQGELQAARGTVQAAETGVVAAESKLRLLGMTSEAIDTLAKDGRVNSRYEVRSPLAGQVVQRELTLGEYVRPDREALMQIVDLSRLWVIADVPQSTLPTVAVGDPARVLLAADGRDAVDGRVAYIAPQVDPNTRTAQVRVEVDAGSLPLRAGMFVQAELTMLKAAGATGPVLAVPQASVQSVDNASVVFVPVLGEPNTFAKRPVGVGPAVGGWVPVLSGLADGQDVVTAGTFVLKAELGKSAVEED